MPKRKSLLKKIVVEKAKGARTCKHNGKRIKKGGTCLLVFDGPRDRNNYSRDVALQMIEDTYERLNALKNELG
jgi:hypothetical protein